jgi:hypothetical protein
MLPTDDKIHGHSNHFSFFYICSPLSSPHGGYYTSLLSEDYQEDLGHDDYVDDENEVREVSPKTHDIRFQNEGSVQEF